MVRMCVVCWPILAGMTWHAAFLRSHAPSFFGASELRATGRPARILPLSPLPCAICRSERLFHDVYDL